MVFSGFRFSLRARYAAIVLLLLVAGLATTHSAPRLPAETVFLLAAVWLLGLLALLAIRSALRRPTGSPSRILTRRALRQPPMTLPPLRQMRDEISILLVSPAPRGDRPESPDHAIRRILERGLASQGAGSASDLSAQGVTELWMLATLLRATPERAGGLARCFRLPDMVLDLHERVAGIAAAHAADPVQTVARRA